MVHVALRLGNVGEELEHDVRDEHPCEVIAIPLSGIQEWEVDYYDEGFLLFGDDSPLLQHFGIAAPKSVETFHYQCIAWSDSCHQTPVGRSVEVIARLFVGIHKFPRNTKFVHCDPLAVVMLIEG